MTLPTADVTFISGDTTDPDNWEFNGTGGGTPLVVGIAVRAFIDVLKALHRTDTTFTNITLYTKASPSNSALPVATEDISIAGTVAPVSGQVDMAVQKTLSFRTGLFNRFKIVSLDVQTGGLGKYKDLTGRTADIAVKVAVIDPEGFIRGRDNALLVAFAGGSIAVNDRLMRAYNRNT